MISFIKKLLIPEVPDAKELSSEEPLLRFEQIAQRLGFKKSYLYPVPLVVLYFITCVVPHLYSLYANAWWKIYYEDLGNTLGWLVLIIAVSYGTIIFRRKYVSGLGKLAREGIIGLDLDNKSLSQESQIRTIGTLRTRDKHLAEATKLQTLHRVYENQIRALVSWRAFVLFLLVFEVMVFYFWYYDVGDNWQFGVHDANSALQIPGTIIMIFVLPVAAETFAAAWAGAFLPYRLRNNIIVKPLHLDHHGGLKPFGEIMLILEYVYVGGIVISIAAFEEFRNTPILWIVFISIMTGLIIAPQKLLYHKLSKAKRLCTEEIQKIYFWASEIRPDTYNLLPKWSSQSPLPFDAAYLTFVKMAKDEVELMKTLSFDIIALYKIAVLLVSLPVISTYLDPIVKQMVGLP